MPPAHALCLEHSAPGADRKQLYVMTCHAMPSAFNTVPSTGEQRTSGATESKVPQRVPTDRWVRLMSLQGVPASEHTGVAANGTKQRAGARASDHFS